MNTCSIKGCNRQTVGRGWCSRHYDEWFYYGVGRPKCSVDGCARNLKARGLCAKHYKQYLHHGVDRPICSVADCDKKVEAHGMCRAHYIRWCKYGDPTIQFVHQPGSAFPFGEAPAICIIDDCDKPAQSKGLCSMHYSRQYRWGSQQFSPRTRLEICPMCREHEYTPAHGHDMCSFCWWRTARSRNGLPRPYYFWDQHTCLKAGMEWAKSTGRMPMTSDWKPKLRTDIAFPSITTVVRRFGSWHSYLDELEARIKREQTPHVTIHGSPETDDTKIIRRVTVVVAARQ